MTESKNIEKFVWKNVGHQYFAVAAGNILNLILGAIQAWITPVVPLLMSDDTPLLNGPLDHHQISWIASSGAIGGIIGNFVCSFITSICGCKQSTICQTLPCVTFWVIIYFGPTYEYLMVARLLGGIVGGGLISTLTIYTSEISNDEIRGKLGSLSRLIRNIGQLISFIIGSTLEYHYTPCVFVFIPVISAIIFMTLPNTPQYYLRRNQNKEAEDALKYYKGYKGESLEENQAFFTELQRLKTIIDQQRLEKKWNYEDLCRWTAIKGILIGCVLAILVVSTGNYILLNYSVLVFKKSGAEISPYVSTVMLFIAQILGCLCTTELADRLGRKVLIIVSVIGSAIGFLTLAAYLYLKENGIDTNLFNWIPVASLSFVVFISAAGIAPLCNLYTIELLPYKVRGFGLCISIFAMSVVSFWTTKSFPIWMEDYGLPITLTIYAISCFIGAFFIILAGNETKGQPMDEVK